MSKTSVTLNNPEIWLIDSKQAEPGRWSAAQLRQWVKVDCRFKSKNEMISYAKTNYNGQGRILFLVHINDWMEVFHDLGRQEVIPGRNAYVILYSGGHMDEGWKERCSRASERGEVQWASVILRPLMALEEVSAGIEKILQAFAQTYEDSGVLERELEDAIRHLDPRSGREILTSVFILLQTFLVVGYVVGDLEKNLNKAIPERISATDGHFGEDTIGRSKWKEMHDRSWWLGALGGGDNVLYGVRTEYGGSVPESMEAFCTWLTEGKELDEGELARLAMSCFEDLNQELS